MYTLYIANKNYSSWSLRPWVLMRECGIPFAEQIVPLSEGSSWESYRKFAPNGRVPCLHDDSSVIWDSLAIVEYLAERHSGIWPSDPSARAWARSAAAEMHSGFGAIRSQCSMSCGVRINLERIDANLQRDLVREASALRNRLNELWAQGLDRFGGSFLTGDSPEERLRQRFTAVDAFFAPIAFRAQTYDLPLHPEYIDRLLALAAMQQWYDAALLESWRETEHEREVLGAGKLVADLRQA